MKIYVLSDTHNSKSFSKFLEIASNADAVIHLGDGMRDKSDLESVLACPVYSVSGNCDIGTNYERLIEIEGIKFLLTHGHMYGVKASKSLLLAHAKEVNASVVLYGHTHVPEITYYPDITVINPGSLTRPKTGFVPTYAVINIENNKLSAKLIEYKGEK